MTTLNINDSSAFVSIEEAAALAHVSSATLRRRVKSGEVRAFTKGRRRILIVREDAVRLGEPKLIQT